VELELRRRVALALDAPVTGFEGAEDMLPLDPVEAIRAGTSKSRATWARRPA